MTAGATSPRWCWCSRIFRRSTGTTTGTADRRSSSVDIRRSSTWRRAPLRGSGEMAPLPLILPSPSAPSRQPSPPTPSPGFPRPPILPASSFSPPLAFSSELGGQLPAGHPALGLADLVSPTASYFNAPLVPLLPVTLIVLIAWVRFRSRQATAAATRLIFVCGLVSGALLLYALAPLPRVSGLRSYDMLFFLGWFLAALTAFSLAPIKIPAARWKGNTGAAALVAATLVAIVPVFPFVTQTMVPT